MGNDWKKVFENPGKEYRSAPFWAWNEKINEQIKISDTRNV